jgi:mannosyltransferase
MSAAHPLATPAFSAAARLPRWWPLAALTLLAAALRLSTLDLQGFWYDEAFTPVHVLHPSLWATLKSMVHSENTPPLWYLLEWVDSRVLGTGEVALRLPSALAGIATVPVAWAIGDQLAGRRAALITAALVAANPLFVWYSQEARAYALFVLMAALAMLCFLRAEREPTRARMATFALTGSLALLTHYFAVFLLIGMVVWLAREPVRRRAARGAVACFVVVGLALLPLILAQGGHGTQWIGAWALSSRLEAIPQYYLTGYSGAPLGHGVELLVALPILAGLGLGLRRIRERPRALRGASIALAVTAAGVLTPILLALLGADYLAPRNLVAAMIPLTALIAVILSAADRESDASGQVSMALAATISLAFLALSVDVDLSPRLQRGNWRDVAHALGKDSRNRAITTVELGSAPLEYYLPPLENLRAGATVTVGEIDEVGYAPLRPSAGRPPARGFSLFDRLDIDGLIVYRFLSPVPRTVSEATLRRHVITLASPEVLVPPGTPIGSSEPERASTERARALPERAPMSSPRKRI